MRRLPTLSFLALALAGALAGCGGGGKQRSSHAPAALAAHSTPTPASGSQEVPHYPGVPRYPGDSDGDNDRNSDEDMRTAGREGSPVERSLIAALVRRYYATALAGDGARACSMLAAQLARSVPLEYGRYGAPYLHGKTCPQVLSKLFVHEHRLVAAVAHSEKLIDVRLEEDHGYAALQVDAPCLPESCRLNLRTLKIANVLIKREGNGSWKIDSLLAVV